MSSSRPVLAVLASGRGSNLEAILRAIQRKQLDAHLKLVISDVADARALAIARDAEVSAEHVSPAGKKKAEYDAELARRLQLAGVEWVALAGYMRIVSGPLLDAFPGRIVNIHPGLLPSFPGLHAQRRAIEAGVKVSGCTVHVVDAGVDTGPIVMQSAVPVLEGDTEETLAERILKQEHQLYPRALQALMHGELTLVDRKVIRSRARHSHELPKRCVISVHDKRGLPELAAALKPLGYEILSTGGTARSLREAGHVVTDVADLTGFPECLTGRVKTLHPAVHAGLLARPDRADDRVELDRLGLGPIQLVVVNLYPFEATAARAGATAEEIREQIDIGGVTLLRAAAKNHPHVTVVVDPDDYPGVARRAADHGTIGAAEERARLAAKAFEVVSHYDAAIAAWSMKQATGLDPAPAPEGSPFPQVFAPRYERVQELRYGENPHQKAAFYRDPTSTAPGLGRMRLLKGKELSYNNLLDADAAVACAGEFAEPAVAIIKHSNPCGLATAAKQLQAFRDAYASDPVSAFGGILGLNRPMEPALAQEIVDTKLFLEVIAAPGFTPAALGLLERRKDLRLIEVPDALGAPGPLDGLEVRGVRGGLLVQTRDELGVARDELKVVSERKPTADELDGLVFAFTVAKLVKSNAIVLVQGTKTVGVGAGQMSRVDSVRIAASKAGERAQGSLLGSDAFFPFPDGVEEAARAGVTAVIQPGGSKNDAAVIEAANKLGLVMVLTGQRHFRH